MSENIGGMGESTTGRSVGARSWSIRPSVVLAVLLVAGLIAFVVQNDSRVPVSWLVLNWEGPLWAVILIAAASGAVLGQVLGWIVRVARRRR